ncbi:hypothetical protein [Polyangium sp. 15x6]|uniref:hypothetical protein n=1 Tax=Polyangium sp. 15x6 TaxID=3042687 RepID=UPI00249A59F3|nr:hypothetical protein [Polyangium sp. 15x6]MDI3290235.1 hypothetical protein [Polyangium sp. 15x6]
MQTLRWSFAALLLGLVACAGSAAEGPGSTEPGAIQSAPNEPPPPAAEGPITCGLPAPVVSEDPCTKDAECAPAEPCHAHACVAVAHAKPRTPDTVCSTMLDCKSVDANPCVCHQGRCALVPKPN